MIDRSLMHRTLTVLEAVGYNGLRESILLDEISLDAARPIEAAQIREHLREACRRGWAESYQGLLGEARWRILPAGANARHDL